MKSYIAVLSVLLMTNGTFAQEAVSIGKLRVRADSPLVKGEYPRLMITRAQLPAIRARLNHPEIQAYLKQARDLVKIDQASPLLLAAMFQLTGDEQYANLAKRWLGDLNWDPAWTFAFSTSPTYDYACGDAALSNRHRASRESRASSST